MSSVNASGHRESVAHRIFLAIFLAAAAPLGLLAAWTLLEVDGELTEQASDRARDLAKSFGVELLARLHVATEELRTLASLDRIARRHPPKSWLEDDPAIGAARWTNLFALEEGREPVLLAGEAGTELTGLTERLPADAPTLRRQFLEIPTRTGTMAQYLAIPLPGGGWVGGRLNPEYVWDKAQVRDLDLSETICYLNDSGEPYFCNKQPVDPWLTAVRAREIDRIDGVAVRDAVASEALVTAVWSFVLALYNNESKWHVAVGIPRSDALAPVDQFREIFPRVALVALIIVGLLSRSVIRGNLRPLSVLLEATRGVQRGELETKVSMSRHDEFQELGSAFNTMTDSLRRQFDHLSLVAELGRLLQERRSFAETLAGFVHVMSGKERIVSAGMLAIQPRDDGRSLLVIPMTQRTEPRNQGALRAIPFDEVLPRLPDERWLGVTQQAMSEFPVLRQLGVIPSGRCVILPAVNHGRVLASLLLSYPDDNQPEDEELVNLDRVAELLGLALQKALLDEQLVYRANHDVLTGLTSRDRLIECLGGLIEAAQATGNELAVIMVYLDNLNSITDASGHALSDRLLIELSQRLRNSIAANDILSRFDGGTFVALLEAAPRMSALERAKAFVANLDEALATAIAVEQFEFSVTVTKGVAIYPYDGGDSVELLRKADAALHEASQVDRGGTVIFNPMLENRIKQRNEAEQALSNAVERGEFILYYQPISNPLDGSIVAAESLIRWERPQFGIIPPDVFIPLAEETGVIQVIGAWALRRACDDFQQWRQRGMHMTYVSVNVSGRQLIADDFADQVAAVLQDTGLPPDKLTLEVTETTVIGRLEPCLTQLNAVRELGVQVAIDDFGTGYASLKYVKQLPADIFKIDRLFVSGLPNDGRDFAIISTVHLLARELGVDLIAEGVETAEQASALKSIGIRKLQGYFYSRPLTREAFVNYLGTHRPQTAMRRSALSTR